MPTLTVPSSGPEVLLHILYELYLKHRAMEQGGRWFAHVRRMMFDNTNRH